MKSALTERSKKGVTAKDVILSVIGKYGVKFGTGYVIEYTGGSIQKHVYGRTHDGLQYVNRSGSAGGTDRSG
ncbi:aconitase family protein [Bacillus velezensis]